MTPHRLRFHLFLIVALSGAAAFLSSVAALTVGVTSMTIRYPLAVAFGYGVFLLLIRGWIALHRRSHRGSNLRGSDVLDPDLSLIDVPIPSRLPSAPDIALFAGGRSGGAGSGAAWSGASVPGGRGSGGSSLSLDFDFDDAWPVALGLICVLGGALAIAYVVYSAPVLLAEVAVDAAIVSGLYRRLKKREPAHWAATVARHTALPAVVLLVFATLAGFAAGRIAPDAHSIGGVIQALRE